MRPPSSTKVGATPAELPERVLGRRRRSRTPVGGHLHSGTTGATVGVADANEAAFIDELRPASNPGRDSRSFPEARPGVSVGSPSASTSGTREPRAPVRSARLRGGDEYSTSRELRAELLSVCTFTTSEIINCAAIRRSLRGLVVFHEYDGQRTGLPREDHITGAEMKAAPTNGQEDRLVRRSQVRRYVRSTERSALHGAGRERRPGPGASSGSRSRLSA